MVETVLVEPDHAGVAALVIAMAGLAIEARGLVVAAVVTLLLAQVLVDQLVAIEAQLLLRRIAQAHVAVAALLLEISMPRDQLARHEKLFDFSRVQLAAAEAAEQQEHAGEDPSHQ